MPALRHLGRHGAEVRCKPIAGGTLRLYGILTAVAAVVSAHPVGAQHGANGQQTAPQGVLEADTIEVTESYPGLVQRAAIAPEGAVRAALGKIKEGRLVSTRIEERGARLVYVIRIDERKGQPRECLVDAETGRVLANRKVPRDRQGGS